MKFITYSHRNGLIIFQDEKYLPFWKDIIRTVSSISEEELILKHESYNGVMSLSRAINELLREKFIAGGWHSESPIFQGEAYDGDRWRLDFVKSPVSIEVGFNHSEAISWNLLKPVMASELNHVTKAIQTEIGVIITATNELKNVGAFDGAVGDFEKYIDYLKPMQNQLSTPLVIIGLLAPVSFSVKKNKVGNRNYGSIVRG